MFLKSEDSGVFFCLLSRVGRRWLGAEVHHYLGRCLARLPLLERRFDFALCPRLTTCIQLPETLPEHADYYVALNYLEVIFDSGLNAPGIEPRCHVLPPIQL